MAADSYSLAQLAQMSMLTERTLHNYLKRGLLRGEKTASGWRFSADEAARFWAQPFVRSAINSKQHGIAEDFLQRRYNTAGLLCAVYDYEPESPDHAFRLCEYFLSATQQYPDVCFTYRFEKNMMRVTLRGKADQVITIMDGALKNAV